MSIGIVEGPGICKRSVPGSIKSASMLMDDNFKGNWNKSKSRVYLCNLAIDYGDCVGMTHHDIVM